MRHLHSLLIALFALLCFSANAQELKVINFEEILGSIEARTQETMNRTGNRACALIKVQLVAEGAKFDGFRLCEDSIGNPGEYLVYLQPGAKSLTVHTPGYNVIEITFKNYNPEIEKVESNTVYRLVLKPDHIAPPTTQQVQIEVSPSNASVILNKEPLRLIDGKASKTLPFGTYGYSVSADGYETEEGQISNYDPEKPTIVNITLKKKIPSGPSTGSNGPTPPKQKTNDYKYEASSFYIEAKFQAGMMMGVGASVGAYISNFNIEGTFLLGLAESEEIAWINKKQTTNSGYTYTYKPMFYGIKLGYGITCSKSFRITPQVGVGVSSITGSQVKAGSGTDPDATSCYAVPASVGARFEYYFTEKFGLSASPEFGFAVMKSDTYTKLSDLSSKVKGFGSGFNARVGIFVSF